ncbi:solute carrier organic anion transporter family member 1C1-like isoform X1 [Lampetra planeri]
MKSDKEQAYPPQLKPPRWANIKVFLLCLSLLFFSKAMSGSYMKSSITSIERRFDLPSSVAGIIDGSFEMGNLLVITAVSYFGARFHRPRIIAAGATLMGLGTLLIALPHFLMGRYSYESIALGSVNVTADRPVCAAHEVQWGASGELSQRPPLDTQGPRSPSPADESCQHETRSLLWVLVLVGNALRGIGESPITPLGISFLDDHARANNSAFYLGCIMTVGLMGPAVGFLIGSFCARLFVDLGFINMEEVTISPQDSRWVGAWWLGFLIAGGITLLTALPLWFFPASVPHEDEEVVTVATKAGDGRGDLDAVSAGEKAHEAAGKEEGVHSAKSQHEPVVKEEDVNAQKVLLQRELGQKPLATPVSMASLAKEFMPSLRALLSNPVFVCLLVNYIFLMNWVAGSSTFSPKYIQEQFGQTASKSNLVIGAANLPMVALGIFLGGVICKRMNPSLLGLATLALCHRLPALLFMIIYFFIGCDGAHVAGISVPYQGTAGSLGGSLLAPCNAHCACSSGAWDPVCGADGVTYASPCLAGCSVMRGSGRDTLFDQCICIGNSSSFSSSGTATWNGTAALGQCPRGDDCNKKFFYFLATALTSSLFSALSFTPGYMLFIRSIRPDLKSFALGIQSLLTRTLGGIPAPIYFGAAIDSTCLKSTGSACSGRGSCRIYDSNAFGRIYISLLVALFLAAIVALANVYRLLRRQARQEKGARAEVECAETQGRAPGFSAVPTVSATSEQQSLKPPSVVDVDCGPRTHLPSTRDRETTF